jgi:hypothetical protein
MTERKHTPGPWEAYDAAAYGTLITCGSLTGQGHRIAYVHLYRDLSVETYAANARLIAAAPELLEALEAVLYWAELIAGDTTDKEAAANEEASIALARAAITKATGDKP